jgi:hypothetical protein
MSQDGNAKLKDARVAQRRSRVVDARRSAGQNDAARLQFSDALRRQIVSHQLAEDVEIPHSPCNQLGVLRTEVEDENAFAVGGNRFTFAHDEIILAFMVADARW